MKLLKFNHAVVIILLAITASLFSCNNQPANTGENNDPKEVNDSIGISVSKSPTTEEKTKLHQRLEELSNKIDTATAKVNNQLATADAATRAKLNKQKDDYASAKATLRSEFDKFTTSSYKEWDNAKAGISNTIDSLEKKLKLD